MAVKRITIDPETVNMVEITDVDTMRVVQRILSPIPFSCEYCGDDLDIHEWVDVDTGTLATVNCDRAIDA
jgi:hypothetical protein